jgi:hypothetical protein
MSKESNEDHRWLVRYSLTFVENRDNF